MKTSTKQKNAQRVALKGSAGVPPAFTHPRPSVRLDLRHCGCDLCRTQAAEETVVVFHVRTWNQHFCTTEGVEALLLAIRLNEPLKIYTEDMSRAEYQAIPATQASAEAFRGIRDGGTTF